MELKKLNVVKVVNDTDTQKIQNWKDRGFKEVNGKGGDEPLDPNLEKLSYQELKAMATGMGLEYAGNISAADLLTLIEGAQKEA